MTQTVCWVNGKLLADGVPALVPADRGFSLGDGVFDTLRADCGTPRDGCAHLDRLLAWAHEIGIESPYGSPALAEAMGAVARRLGAPHAAVRTTITRGPASARGLPPRPPQRPTVVIQAAPFDPETVETPVCMTVSHVRRNPSSPASRMKSCSALDQILAVRAAQVAGFDDALLLATDGRVACATAANVFAVVGGLLVTPPEDAGAVPGLTREAVLAAARATGVRCAVRDLWPAELERADELFLTNSLIGVRPVAALDQRAWPAAPGPVTRRLRAALL